MQSQQQMLGQAKAEKEVQCKHDMYLLLKMERKSARPFNLTEMFFPRGVLAPRRRLREAELSPADRHGQKVGAPCQTSRSRPLL